MKRVGDIILAALVCALQTGRATAQSPLTANTEGSTSITSHRVLPNVQTRSAASASSEQLPLGRVEQVLTPGEQEVLESEPKGAGSGTWIQLKEVGKVVGALALVIGLILLTKKAVTSKGVLGGLCRPSGVIEILARYPVGKGQQLMVVKIARRVLLVSQGPQGASTLAEFSDPDEVANLLSRMEAGASGQTIKRFRNLLNGIHSGDRSEAMEHLTTGGESAVVDLTRSQGGPLTRLFNGRGR